MPTLTKKQTAGFSKQIQQATDSVSAIQKARGIAPTTSAPAPGSAASIAVKSPFSLARSSEDIAADQARQNMLKVNGADANLSVNPNREYRDKLKQYQGQIDATNAVYQDQLNAARLTGQGRLGSSRASQGRSGLLGSDFGAAQTDTITTANQGDERAIQNERQSVLSSIYSLARQDANTSLTAKKTAKKAGADALLKYYTEDVPAQKTGRVGKVAKALFDKTIDPTSLSTSEKQKLATDWNVSIDDIASAYGDLKTSADTLQSETALKTRKAEADISKIEADIASGKLINLGEGNKLFDTVTGKVVAYNPKTYAPKEPSDETITPLGGESPFVAQSNYSKLNAGQKKQADSLNNLVRSLKEYKVNYNTNPGAFGGIAGNMFGGDSGLLQTKLNSIIFAAAQAEGTGALQTADREVIEQIIPNPTNIKGAFNTATKGGKAGNVAKIDDQIKKYTANLAGYGLLPVANDVPSDVAPVKAEDPEYDEYLKSIGG